MVEKALLVALIVGALFMADKALDGMSHNLFPSACEAQGWSREAC